VGIGRGLKKWGVETEKGIRRNGVVVVKRFSGLAGKNGWAGLESENKSKEIKYSVLEVSNEEKLEGCYEEGDEKRGRGL